MANTNTNQTIDILRVEGIMAQGYGLNPKIVMRDKRLDLEAKAIYGYLSSFAGGGNQAFPSRDIMLDELKISKDRYYKYIKQLVAVDYIRIERTKGQSGAFDKNVYTIVALPNPVVTETESEEVHKKHSASSEEKGQSAGRGKNMVIKKLAVKARASVNELRQRLDIDNLKRSDPESAEIIEDVFMAVEDMDNSEQITISGNVKKKEAIQELLNQLTSDHIRLVSNIIKSNKQPLKNRKKYLQACIINSIFDIRNQKVEAEDTIDRSKEIMAAEAEKEREQQECEIELQKAYESYPKLKEIDEKMVQLMMKRSRAALSGDELLNRSLQNQVQTLQEQRDLFIKTKGLKSTI